RFDRLRVSPRIGDRAVARHAAGEAMRLIDFQRLETLFDALMRVSQAFFETEHFFADDLKAEMAWLDDAGMHGSDWNFVYAVAFDLDERIRLFTGLPFRRCDKVALQRKAVDRPTREP